MCDEGDWNGYTIQIHSLKSNALNIGSSQLSEQCLSLEMAGKRIREDKDTEENIRYILEHHGEVMTLYDQVVELAKGYCK